MWCTQEVVHTGDVVHILGGALGLVVHDAAVGVQLERESVARPLHGVVEGREADHNRGAQHLGRDGGRCLVAGIGSAPLGEVGAT